MSGRLHLPSEEEDQQIAEGIASDPDAAPDLSEEIAGVISRPDLSFTGLSSEALNIRLDRDVVSYFRNTGPGWQTRINDVLRKAAGL